MFRIGAFARLSGVSAKTLRAWDEEGLFKPVWVDPTNEYRYYSAAQLPELRRIVALRDVGVSLPEIAGLVAGGADLRAVLVRRRGELERERREVERRLQALDISVEMADGGAASLDVVLTRVPAEPVATYGVDPSASDLGPAFYELEAYVRDLGRRAPRPPGAIVGGDEGRRATEVFVPVTGPVPSAPPIGYRRLPACRAASIIHRGSYGRLGASRVALERWVEAAGLALVGPLRILYLQFGAEPELRLPPGYVVERDADYLTELQQPVA
jgi:DNA-binding transcriptional MerR regulator/effector-binding domain-containing protein